MLGCNRRRHLGVILDRRRLPAILPEHGGEVERQRQRAGLAKLLPEADRLAAALHGLVRVTEQPEGHGAEGQTRHARVLPVEEGVTLVSLGIVQGNCLLHVFARGRRVADAERRDRERLAGLD